MNETSEPGDQQGFPRTGLTWLGGDFSTRLVSGLAMAVIAAGALVAGAAAFNILVFVLALILSWEWGRLVHGRGAEIVIAVHVGAAALAVGLAALGFVGLGLLALPIGAILAMLLSLGRHSLFAGLGVFYAALPAVTLIWLRSDPTYGLRAAVFVILVVIAADTGAFLAGRGLAGPKLWPSVSPNKTWAGLFGGVLAGGTHGRPDGLGRAGQFGAAAGGHGGGPRLSGANGRSYGIGNQAPVRCQGYERADTRPWWHNGSLRRAGDRGDGGGLDRVLCQRAFAGTRAAVGVLRMGARAAVRRASDPSLRAASGSGGRRQCRRRRSKASVCLARRARWDRARSI